MLKSKIEVREFAVTQAVEIMGKGTSDKDVVSKAKEIEAYIIGDAELPEVSTSEISDIASAISSAIGLNAAHTEVPTKEEPAKKEKKQ